MIFVDSNLFEVDRRYAGDVHSRVHRRALDRPGRQDSGVTSVLSVLEACGILTFDVSPSSLLELHVRFARRHRLTVVPAGACDTRLLDRTAREVFARMGRGMALEDAEIALVVDQEAAGLDVSASWNARRFASRIAVPAMPPLAWLPRRNKLPRA